MTNKTKQISRGQLTAVDVKKWFSQKFSKEVLHKSKDFRCQKKPK